jgi:hypothetical protein
MATPYKPLICVGFCPFFYCTSPVGLAVGALATLRVRSSRFFAPLTGRMVPSSGGTRNDCTANAPPVDHAHVGADGARFRSVPEKRGSHPNSSDGVVRFLGGCAGVDQRLSQCAELQCHRCSPMRCGHRACSPMHAWRSVDQIRPNGTDLMCGGTGTGLTGPRFSVSPSQGSSGTSASRLRTSLSSGMSWNAGTRLFLW